jgi:hypothetical protein
LELTGVLIEAPMARTPASSTARLRGAHVVVGSMFRLQRSFSLVEPHAPNSDDSRARLPRDLVGDAYVGNVKCVAAVN